LRQGWRTGHGSCHRRMYGTMDRASKIWEEQAYASSCGAGLHEKCSSTYSRNADLD
jgi:hypothetical protein